MSRQTIRVINHFCDVWNWNESLKNAYEDEKPYWTKKRDLKLATLQRAVAALTPADIAFLKKYNPDIERELAEVGAPFAGEDSQDSRQETT